MTSATTPQFLVSPHGERYLHDVNRDAFAGVPSERVLDDWFDTDFAAPDTLWVVVGSDSGLLARWLVARGLGEGSAAVLVEPDELHGAVAGELGETLDGTDVSVCAASGWNEAITGKDLRPWLYAGRLLLVESTGCRSDYCGLYAPLLRELRSSLAERVRATGMGLNARTFMRTQLHNIADNRVPAGSVGRIGEGCTAIVLGGGPSLDDHLGWVLRHRGSLFVIAVSRIGARLSAAGIVPDVVMAVDPQDILFDVSRETMRLERTTLVSAYHVVPSLLQQWAGPCLYTGSALPWESRDVAAAPNIDSVGSTVSHAAVWLAYRWGFSRILLSGVDLCYAPGGATHASGSLESMCAALPSHYESQVTTYAGRRAGTAMPLKIGRDELEAMGRTIAETGVRLVNLAPDAARVESIEHVPVDAIELDVAAPGLDVPDDDDATRRHLERTRVELAGARRGLRAVRRGCAEARKCLDGLHGTDGRAPDYRHKRKLDALDRRLERRESRWMKLVKRHGALDFARTIAPSGFEGMNDAVVEAWGRGYYRIVDDNAGRLLELVDAAAERVGYRLDELLERPPVERLVEYWRRDGTPGRGRRVFRDVSGELGAAPREALAGAAADFEAALTHPEPGYARRLAREKADAGNLLRTIALLVAERGVEDLESLARALLERGAEHAPLGEWAAGRLAELRGDAGPALERYREVLDHHAGLVEAGEAAAPGAERLLEDVLLRIVHLQLAAGDGLAALDGLDLLASLSPAHVPRRAELLVLLGRTDEAIEALQGLLESGRGDWRTALQLSTLYTRVGATEAAALAARMSADLRGGRTVDAGNGHGTGQPELTRAA